MKPASDHPRSRGEYPVSEECCDYFDGSSPLSRGIQLPNHRTTTHIRIIPALAGNTAEPPPNDDNDKDHPRSRGEYSNGLTTLRWCGGSSPLSRGIPSLGCENTELIRIIPALAGNTLPLRQRLSIFRDHPRSRGEYMSWFAVTCCTHGSSPLSRGILSTMSDVVRSDRIIPALAGNTPSAQSTACLTSDHPRSRGEYFVEVVVDVDACGSSPLSRGIRRRSLRLITGDGIIPALAGNTSRVSVARC